MHTDFSPECGWQTRGAKRQETIYCLHSSTYQHTPFSGTFSAATTNLTMALPHLDLNDGNSIPMVGALIYHTHWLFPLNICTDWVWYRHCLAQRWPKWAIQFGISRDPEDRYPDWVSPYRLFRPVWNREGSWPCHQRVRGPTRRVVHHNQDLAWILRHSNSIQSQLVKTSVGICRSVCDIPGIFFTVDFWVLILRMCATGTWSIILTLQKLHPI